MNQLSNLFKKLFYRKSRPATADVEELRIAFKERYHNFKLLLNANNRSLEVMANIEAALQGQRPFGMSFVKASYTAASVNVLHMIKNIDALSHGKYQELYARFNAIQQHIDRLLT